MKQTEVKNNNALMKVNTLDWPASNHEALLSTTKEQVNLSAASCLATNIYNGEVVGRTRYTHGLDVTVARPNLNLIRTFSVKKRGALIRIF